MKFMGIQSSNELQWFYLNIRHNDSNFSNDYQGDMNYSIHACITTMFASNGTKSI